MDETNLPPEELEQETNENNLTPDQILAGGFLMVVFGAAALVASLYMTEATITLPNKPDIEASFSSTTGDMFYVVLALAFLGVAFAYYYSNNHKPRLYTLATWCIFLAAVVPISSLVFWAIYEGEYALIVAAGAEGITFTSDEIRELRNQPVNPLRPFDHPMFRLRDATEVHHTVGYTRIAGIALMLNGWLWLRRGKNRLIEGQL